jgi:hypothetical protein
VRIRENIARWTLICREFMQTHVEKLTQHGNDFCFGEVRKNPMAEFVRLKRRPAGFVDACHVVTGSKGIDG